MSAAFFDHVRGRSDVVPSGYTEAGLRAYRYLVYLGASQMVQAQFPDLRGQLGEDAWRLLDELRGDKREATFGSQIRNYVLYPYQMVKDVRSGVETGNVEGAARTILARLLAAPPAPELLAEDLRELAKKASSCAASWSRRCGGSRRSTAPCSSTRARRRARATRRPRRI